MERRETKSGRDSGNEGTQDDARKKPETVLELIRSARALEEAFHRPFSYRRQKLNQLSAGLPFDLTVAQITPSVLFGYVTRRHGAGAKLPAVAKELQVLLNVVAEKADPAVIRVIRVTQSAIRGKTVTEQIILWRMREVSRFGGIAISGSRGAD